MVLYASLPFIGDKANAASPRSLSTSGSCVKNEPWTKKTPSHGSGDGSRFASTEIHTTSGTPLLGISLVLRVSIRSWNLFVLAAVPEGPSPSKLTAMRRRRLYNL